MGINIDDVPVFQVLDIHQGDPSQMSLFVSGLDDGLAADLTASLGGTRRSQFEDPPVLYDYFSMGGDRYLIILSLTGTVVDGSGGLLSGEIFDPDDRPFDPELTVTLTSGPLTSNTYDVIAIYINPAN